MARNEGIGKILAKEEAAYLEYEASFADPMDLIAVPLSSDGKKTKETWRFIADDPIENLKMLNGDIRMVGDAPATADTCGKFKSPFYCDHEHHVPLTYEGGAPLLPMKGTHIIYVKPTFFGCYKAECHACFKTAWGKRASQQMADRITYIGNVNSWVPEHIVYSPPQKEWGFPLARLVKDAYKRLMARGIHGGSMIFHPCRKRKRAEALKTGKPEGWYISPHFHILGFCSADYVKCRMCEKSTTACLNCNGYEGITRREYEKDKCIVKVLDERETLVGTAWYQLNHAGYENKGGRPKIFWYWGTCGTRKAKYKPLPKPEMVCPEHGTKLKRGKWVGKDPVYWGDKDIKRYGCFMPMYDLDGNPRIVPDEPLNRWKKRKSG